MSSNSKNSIEGQGRIVPMRLQKFLARAGAASRRGSENLMTAGRVTVNGRVVRELGSRIDPLIDEVAVDGVVVRISNRPVTIMLNKPAGYITTMSDPHGRPCVAELVPLDQYPGLYPVGRLDQDTTGLLLFSTDGDLGNVLLHPRHHVEKVYIACVQGRLSEEDVQRLSSGIELEDGMTLPARIETLEDGPAAPRSRSMVKVTIREGRKRQVKRMFEAVKHPVVTLHRAEMGPLCLGDLPEGAWRLLEDEELASLYRVFGR